MRGLLPAKLPGTAAESGSFLADFKERGWPEAQTESHQAVRDADGEAGHGYYLMTKGTRVHSPTPSSNGR